MVSCSLIWLIVLVLNDIYIYVKAEDPVPNDAEESQAPAEIPHDEKTVDTSKTKPTPKEPPKVETRPRIPPQEDEPHYEGPSVIGAIRKLAIIPSHGLSLAKKAHDRFWFGI